MNVRPLSRSDGCGGVRWKEVERFKTKAFEGVEVEGGRCGCEEAAVRGEARVVVGVSVNLDVFSSV